MGEQSQPNIIGVIVARQESKRLPNKCLRLIGEKPMLQVEYERIKQSKLINEMWIATHETSYGIVRLCDETDMNCYRHDGNPNDVLQRIHDAFSDQPDETILVKFNADSPLIDGAMVDRIIKNFNVDFGFVSRFPKGMHFNMFTVGALKKLCEKISVEDRSIWNKVNETWVWYKYEFKVRGFEAQFDFSDINLEVNTLEDLELVRAIFAGEGDV